MRRVIVQAHRNSILFAQVRDGESAIYINAAGNDLRVSQWRIVNVGPVGWLVVKALGWLLALGKEEHNIVYEEFEGEG